MVEITTIAIIFGIIIVLQNENHDIKTELDKIKLIYC